MGVTVLVTDWRFRSHFLCRRAAMLSSAVAFVAITTFVPSTTNRPVLDAHVPTSVMPLTPASIASLTRREAVQQLSVAALLMPQLAVAASSSPQQMLKSRAVYGSRVYRLQQATPATILEEKNVFTLFITGVYGASADKATRKALEKLEAKALAAASKGDAPVAQAAVKEFIALGQIEELDMLPGTYFNAKSPCDRAGLQCGYQYQGYLGSRMEPGEMDALNNGK